MAQWLIQAFVYHLSMCSIENKETDEETRTINSAKLSAKFPFFKEHIQSLRKTAVFICQKCLVFVAIINIEQASILIFRIQGKLKYFDRNGQLSSCSSLSLYDPVFIFVTEREHNFQKGENIAFTLHLERKKKFIGTHTGILWSVVSLVWILLCKNKYIGATLTVFSFAAIVWPRHTTPSIPHWGESAMHEDTK